MKTGAGLLDGEIVEHSLVRSISHAYPSNPSGSLLAAYGWHLVATYDFAFQH